MNILIVGSGGREHAIAWKVAQSKHCSRLWIAPGNAGTARLGENISLQVDDITGIVAFAREVSADLVIIGPEVALAAGLADALNEAGIRTFGPSQAAARIETSKAFSKAFMQRHNIPTARFSAFTQYTEALDCLRNAPYPVVIKTSGLAAGKGVFLPSTLQEGEMVLQSIMLERVFGASGEEVILEERLEGEEVSLLAFSDGLSVLPMLPAQDHKRLQDGDTGPNTGGMGAYAPAPVCPPSLVDTLTRTVLQLAVDGLRAEGCPFVGVLYAGLILTPSGPQVLEFNCRFGDPETQVILPMLESDLLEIIDACVDQRLDQVSPKWKEGAAVTVVLASEGYPGKIKTGQHIFGLENQCDNCTVFHAGTSVENGQVVTAGGRVLNVTATGPDLKQALASAYTQIQSIHFSGMQHRSDIAFRALKPDRASPVQVSQPTGAYALAGVNIDAGNRAVALMKDAVRSTYTPNVLAGIGAFGGLFDASALQSMSGPILVASTDGVGTKVRMAAAAGRYEGIGADIVNHCINDILVQGASPMFFLDYFATARLDPEIAAQVVQGISSACRESGCVLLGGETAEMPGVYAEGEFDLAGTIVGVVEREQVLPCSDLHPGDLLVGLASSGPHTNGFSLIRQVFAEVSLDTVFPELGKPLADMLLVPHRSYLPLLKPVLSTAALSGESFGASHRRWIY